MINIEELKKDYQSGINIIKKLKKIGVDLQTCIEISYDIQAGSYTRQYYENRDVREKPVQCIQDIMLKNNIRPLSILEAGCGEANTLGLIKEKLDPEVPAYGFDISMSRLFYAKKFLSERSVKDVQLFLGNLLNIPVADGSIDFVYTFHSVEPNGGFEKEILSELFRISGRYLLLVEPIFELASDSGKKRMIENGYVRGLRETCEKLNFEIVDFGKLPYQVNELNTTGYILIRKNEDPRTNSSFFRDPVSNSSLISCLGGLYSEISGYYYPVIDGIPVLHSKYGILITQIP